MSKRNPVLMSLDELEDELHYQREYSKDDSFEYRVSGRGDNGFRRIRWINQVEQELVYREAWNILGFSREFAVKLNYALERPKEAIGC